MKHAHRNRVTPVVAGWLLTLVGAMTLPASAATIVADAQTLGVNAAATARLTASRTFTVGAAGQVQVTLRDLGTPAGAATGFSKLQAVVSHGAAKVASLSAPGTVQFTATPGVHKVQVIGTAVAPAGTFDIVVQTLPGNAQLLQFADGIQAAAAAGNPAQTSLDTTFNIADPGAYQITLTDRVFPAALTSIDLLLVPPGGAPVMLSGPCSTACTVNFNAATAGNYNLLVVATAANPDQMGLYSVGIAGGPSGATAYASTQPVGLLAAPLPLTLPAGGGLTLELADFATPVALTSLQAIVTQGATALGFRSGNGTTALGAGTAGAASLFLFRKAGAGGAGSFGASILQGSTVVYRDARPVPEGFDATSNVGGYRYAFNIPAAATYRAQLRDSAFPTAFGSLRGVIVQNGGVVQALDATGVANPSLAAGSTIALVLGSPLGAGSNSLYGLSIAPAAGGAAALDRAEGVGPLIATRQIDIPVAGSHDLTVIDLLFPDAFADLAVAVTDGSTLVGQIFGSGKITFNAGARPHFISLLARPASTAEYATWGYEVATTPPAPVVTLAATPASVSSGGTSSLSWTATNATNCTASGGWAGTKALSGTEVTAALTTATSFTLTCVGIGGSTVRTAEVIIAAGESTGGGGRVDLLLLALLTCVAWRVVQMRRRAVRQ